MENNNAVATAVLNNQNNILTLNRNFKELAGECNDGFKTTVNSIVLCESRLDDIEQRSDNLEKKLKKTSNIVGLAIGFAVGYGILKVCNKMTKMNEIETEDNA